MLAEFENALLNTVLIDPHPSEPITGHAALAISELNEAALTRKDLR